MTHERSRENLLTKVGLLASGAALLAACGTQVETGEAKAPSFNQPGIFMVEGKDSQNRLVLRGCVSIGSADPEVNGVEIFGDKYAMASDMTHATMSGGSIVWNGKADGALYAAETDPQKLADKYGKNPSGLSGVPDVYHADVPNADIECGKHMPAPHTLYFMEGADRGLTPDFDISQTPKLQGAIVSTELGNGKLVVLAQPHQ